ncbi:putative phosphoglucomutase/phosphomannomutase [Actinoplanes missouriensis 431]|uniref:Phosphoglucosamine mutase n=1 Tax=Actinoplanes missouriensis (strain ATCC 14538 / DSM 43046 / CBS 188.64 / JCM 3121 / NBRC 102363 / NCIMB 12654 / NRRL B-3342 / UNCC 431) TaxID=512565 RepID=I0GYP1_ACTM4|nr:phosphoglucosamine mutase [Actinoplanes missouriensis]BAL85878.1 putative phosphoglucomutase/phosphomannomutase [Actinoplanes missouriensis 431]
MGRLFGTDGVRGLANGDLLTPELALSVAVAAARVLVETDSSHQPLAIVGRDPRASGEMLEAAVVAGLTSAGANVVRVGVLPTPAVAYLVGQTNADLGVMLSASHNPMPDNGIKLFAAGGAKLPDDLEAKIEQAVADGHGLVGRPTGAAIGRVHDLLDGAEHYIKHLIEATPHPLAGLKVVVDCANGAASDVAPVAYREAGAEVIAIHAEPDGLNINEECGSTHLDKVREAVLAEGADLGLAHDGDADRCLAVTAAGDVVDGDQIMAILALAMRDAGTLTDNTLVATVMSNLGLRIAMKQSGIRLLETKVGDRYVLEELQNGDYALGGEQSGHIVMPAYATTGDGVLTGLHLMAQIAASGKSLADLAAVVHKLPQVLINVRVGDREAGAAAPTVQAAVALAENELGETGRVLLRPSGTEPLVRVMVEAATEDKARSVAERIADEVRAASPA